MIPVEHSEKLTNIFGKWPSFHDAEGVRIVLDREGPDGPSFESQIHVFEMTSEIDSAGYYVLRHHTLVTLKFIDVAMEEIRWFNHQNVLSSLAISRMERREDERDLHVEMGSSYGVEAVFDCRRAIVADVTPYLDLESDSIAR